MLCCFDGKVQSIDKFTALVIPAHAGIQNIHKFLGCRLSPA